VLAGAQRAKLEHPSSAFAALRHLLPHGEKGGTASPRPAITTVRD